jgi:hypothetical protein
MVDIEKLKAKFFTDPDWAMMEELIRSYTTPLESSLNIDVNLSNDQIATEVRGRQLAVKSLEEFLTQSGILRPRIISEPVTFK